jgi:hypothetical protein
MATVRKEILTKAGPEMAWHAIRDIGALHTRLQPKATSGDNVTAG